MNREAFNEALKIAPDSDILNLVAYVGERWDAKKTLYKRARERLTSQEFLQLARQSLLVEEIPDWIDPIDLFPALAKERAGDIFQKNLAVHLGQTKATALLAEIPLEELAKIEGNCALDHIELGAAIANYEKIGIEGVIDLLIDHDREWIIDFLVTQLGFTDQTDVLFARAADMKNIRFADYENEEAILLVDVIP